MGFGIRYSLVGFVITLVLYLLIIQSNHLNISNTKWLKDENEFEKSRLELIEDFNEVEQLIISVTTKDKFFNEAVLSQIKDFTQKLETIKEVESVMTPINSAYLIKHGNDLNNVSLEYALETNLISLDDVAEIVSASFYQDILFNKQYNKFNIIITPNLGDNKISDRIELIRQIEPLINQYSYLKQDYYFSGKTFLYHQLDKKNKSNIYLISVIVLLFTLVFITSIYRDQSRIIITALNSSIALLVTLSLFRIFAINFSLLSLCLPVIAIIVTISDSIFVFNQYSHLSNAERLNNVYIRLVHKIWKPCLITSITTCFSFLSYFFSEIKPLYDLSFIAVLAVLINYLWVVFVTPFVLIFLGSRAVNPPLILSRLLDNIFQFVRQGNSKLLRNFILLLVALSPMMFFIKTETNFLNIFFFKSEKIVQNILRFDQEFAGSSDFSVIYEEATQHDFKQVAFFNKMTRELSDLAKIAEVRGVRSYQDIALDSLSKLSETEESFSEDFQLEQVLLFLEFSRNEQSHDVMADYISFDYSKGRAKLYTNNLSSSEIERVSSKILQVLNNSQATNVKIAGTNAYFDGISKNLIATQFSSLCFVLIMLFISVLIFYNLKTALIASLVNCIPLLLLIIFSVLLQINFDFSYVLVTIICFGITVDCTVHFLHEYNVTKDLHAVITKTGIAISEISLFFIICFAAFLFSDLLIFVKFAGLAILAITLSYVTNILLVPVAMRTIL